MIAISFDHEFTWNLGVCKNSRSEEGEDIMIFK